MSEDYNLDYTKEEIDVILQEIKDCITNDNFMISQNKNREENIQFIQDYNLNASKQKAILLSIKTTDFCYSKQNMNPRYEKGILYIFCPQWTLYDISGEEEYVDIYTKFSIKEYEDNKRVVTISFHKRNKEIDYLFR